MSTRGFLGDCLMGLALGIGGRIGWGLVGYLLQVFSDAVHNS